VYDILVDLHRSGFLFRVVVVGKGAILESTCALGPKMNVAQSPSSGANLLTFASEDQGFEYHLQLSEVSKVVFAVKETPKKVLRIVRMLNAEGESMTSLVLHQQADGGGDGDGDAIQFFDGLIEKYGSEVQL